MYVLFLNPDKFSLISEALNTRYNLGGLSADIVILEKGEKHCYYKFDERLPNEKRLDSTSWLIVNDRTEYDDFDFVTQISNLIPKDCNVFLALHERYGGERLYVAENKKIIAAFHEQLYLPHRLLVSEGMEVRQIINEIKFYINSEIPVDIPTTLFKNPEILGPTPNKLDRLSHKKSFIIA